MQEANQLLVQLKQKKYHNIYFLCGEEPYYIDLISDYIEENVLDENEKAFNQSVLYGRDVDIDQLVGEAKRYPMMSEYTVIICKEAQNIKKIEALSTYLENVSPTCILVVCYKYKTPDGRTEFGKKIKKSAGYLESKKLYANQLPDWISDYAQKQKLTAHPRASLMMAEYLGNDLSKIANEINKLAITLTIGTEITVQHVQENIGISKEYNVFELQTALGQRDVLKANRIINYFSQSGNDNPPQMIIPSLYNYFLKIMLLHKIQDKSQASKILGVNPYFLKEYEVASRLYNPIKLVEIVNILRTYDLKSKGVDGTMTNEALYKEMIYKILH